MCASDRDLLHWDPTLDLDVVLGLGALGCPWNTADTISGLHATMHQTPNQRRTHDSAVLSTDIRDCK